MDQPVDGGHGHGLVGEDLVPAAEGLIGRDSDAAVFVAPGDQFEENAGLGLVLVGIGDVVENDQVELVELGQGGFEDQVAARGLEPLHQIAGTGIEHAVTCLDQGMANGAEDVILYR